MLPVMGHPAVVEEFAGFFRRMFSWHQFRRFKQYLSGLITGGKATVRSIASRLVERADQSSLNRFLTLYGWDEERLNRRRLGLLQSSEETRWRREGVVAIDDTLLPKRGRKIPGAGKLWDHSSGRYVHAQCLVTSHYADSDRDYPIGLRQYFKHDSPEAERHGFKTKVELAKELVDECEMLGVAAENYVFDAWFLSQELAEHVEAYGKGWVSRLKSNRIVHTGKGSMSVRGWAGALPREAFKEVGVKGRSFWAYTRVLEVNKLGKVRVVVCHDDPDLEGDPVYLVTGRLYWEERRVIEAYGLRFRIDNFYKDAKQNLGLGGCNLRSLKGTRRHWQLGILGYSLLRARICRSRLYRRLQSDETIGAECRQAFMDLLQNLIQWIYSNSDRLPLEKILDVILR
jgi:hypothetical protein